MLREWEIELDARSDDEKRTTKGKVAATTHKQTRANLKPFLILLSRRAAPDDILKHTEKIVDFCEEHEYVRANEAYLMLAIGNAAWPMGMSASGVVLCVFVFLPCVVCSFLSFSSEVWRMSQV